MCAATARSWTGSQETWLFTFFPPLTICIKVATSSASCFLVLSTQLPMHVPVILSAHAARPPVCSCSVKSSGRSWYEGKHSFKSCWLDVLQWWMTLWHRPWSQRAQLWILLIWSSIQQILSVVFNKLLILIIYNLEWSSIREGGIHMFYLNKTMGHSKDYLSRILQCYLFVKDWTAVLKW